MNSQGYLFPQPKIFPNSLAHFLAAKFKKIAVKSKQKKG